MHIGNFRVHTNIIHHSSLMKWGEGIWGRSYGRTVRVGGRRGLGGLEGAGCVGREEVVWGQWNGGRKKSLRFVNGQRRTETVLRSRVGACMYWRTYTLALHIHTDPSTHIHTDLHILFVNTHLHSNLQTYPPNRIILSQITTKSYPSTPLPPTLHTHTLTHLHTHTYSTHTGVSGMAV